MKKLLLLGLLLASTSFVHAATPSAAVNKGLQTHATAKDDATYSVTITVVADLLGLEVPVNLAIVSSSGLVGNLLSNLLGIVPPIDIKAGDTITVSALGYETKSFVFDPGVSNYLNSDSKATGTKVAVKVKIPPLK